MAIRLIAIPPYMALFFAKNMLHIVSDVVKRIAITLSRYVNLSLNI